MHNLQIIIYSLCPENNHDILHFNILYIQSKNQKKTVACLSS